MHRAGRFRAVHALPFAGQEDKKKTDIALDLFERQCIGETNVIYERFVFNRRNQENTENFEG